MSEDRDKQMIRRALQVFAVPWIMVLGILLAYLAGMYVDRRLGLSVPLATIVLMAIAVVGGAYQSYRIIMRVLRDTEP
jgi:ABC-type Co2+ transport system permease subunit